MNVRINAFWYTYLLVYKNNYFYLRTEAPKKTEFKEEISEKPARQRSSLFRPRTPLGKKKIVCVYKTIQITIKL